MNTVKLNPECIRDILLEVEDTVSPNNFFEFPPYEKLQEKYSDEEIAYHLQQCEYHDFFVGFKRYSSNGFMVRDLSPAGHKFIANIRENTVWNGVKKISSKVGSTSLEALVTIASNVITELIKSQFGLSGQTSVL